MSSKFYWRYWQGEGWNSYLLEKITASGGCKVLLGCDNDAKAESGPAIFSWFFVLIRRMNFFLSFLHNISVEQSKERQVHPKQDIYLEAIILCSCE